jgi:CelD/BcsL family acetyltransferase involved in cellulose biosynthesis
MSARAALEVDLIDRLQDLPLDAAAWNALLAGNDTNTVFQTYEWFEAWWSCFGAEHSLFMLVVRDASIIVGFAPFMLRRAGWMRQLEFAGSGNSDYQDFVLPTRKAEAMAVICRKLRAESRRWDRLALTNVPQSSSTLREFAAVATANGLRIVEEARVACPALVLNDEAHTARRMIDKYSLRRPLNWFSKRGDVQFRNVRNADEVAKLLPVFFEQHRRRWNSIGKPSLFGDPRQERFYEALARALSARGWLQFSVVEFNGVPIAFHFGFDYQDCVTWYKPAFEIRYAEHSPGLLLMRQLIADGLERERREVDFTIGNEAFKGRFASQQRYNDYVAVYHGWIAYQLALGVRAARRFAGRVLRRLHLLERDSALSLRPVDSAGQAT